MAKSIKSSISWSTTAITFVTLVRFTCLLVCDSVLETNCLKKYARIT